MPIINNQPYYQDKKYQCSKEKTVKKYILLLLAATSLVQAETFNVSTTAEFRIALSTAATNGEDDIINLADGIYKTTDDEKGTFIYFSIEENTLDIVGSSKISTILDGDNHDRVIFLQSLSKMVVFKNLSISNGYINEDIGTTEKSRKGAGIWIDTDFKLENVILNLNATDIARTGIHSKVGYFSAIYLHWDKSPRPRGTINNSIIEANRHLKTGYYAIGGRISINDSIIQNNQNGAISVEDGNEYKNLIIQNNTGFRTIGSCNNDWKILDSIIVNNNSGEFASVIDDGCSGSINDAYMENVKIIGNSGKSIFRTTVGMKIFNSIISNNISNDQLAMSVRNNNVISNTLINLDSGDISIGSETIITNSIFLQQGEITIGDYSQIRSSYVNESRVNGLFISLNNVFEGIRLGFINDNNYKLQVNSDLIDIGESYPKDFILPDFDADKSSRILGQGIDIGPYEFDVNRDSDDDGVTDINDIFPMISLGLLSDSDRDGAPDICDDSCTALGMTADTDDDNDSLLDTIDTYPLISIGELLDTDSDGAPDTCNEVCIDLGMAADTDDDNDGVLDTADTYPLIATGDLVDTDLDGAPDDCDEACVALGMAADSDDDNDGVKDIANHITFYTTNNLSPELLELPIFVETLTKPDLIRGKLELNPTIIPDYRLTSYSNPVTAYEIIAGSYEISASTQQFDNEIRITGDQNGRALQLYIWPKSSKKIDGKQVTTIVFTINLPEDFVYEAGQTLVNVGDLFVLTNDRFNANGLSIWWEDSGRTGNLDLTYNSFQIADAYPLISQLVRANGYRFNDGAPDTCDEACASSLGMAADADDDNDGVARYSGRIST